MQRRTVPPDYTAHLSDVLQSDVQPTFYRICVCSCTDLYRGALNPAAPPPHCSCLWVELAVALLTCLHTCSSSARLSGTMTRTLSFQSGPSVPIILLHFSSTAHLSPVWQPDASPAQPVCPVQAEAEFCAVLFKLLNCSVHSSTSYLRVSETAWGLNNSYMSHMFIQLLQTNNNKSAARRVCVCVWGGES